MSQSKVDLPALIMVLFFTANIVVDIYDPFEMPILQEIGWAVFVLGFLVLIYVALYLRSGFFGATDPNLDHLITKGPYAFCRHPLYVSFLVIMIGMDLIFRSPTGLIFTFLLSLPSAVYRARIEDKLLRAKFGEEWDRYARKVGFMLPKLSREAPRVD